MNLHRIAIAKVLASISAVLFVSTPTIIVLFMALVFLYVIFSIIASGVKAKRRGLLTAEQVQAASREELDKALDEWTLPPELNSFAPRMVRKAPLGKRMLRAISRLMLFAFFGVVAYGFGFLMAHEFLAHSWQDLHAYLSRAIYNFIFIPHWDPWMLWPSVIFTAVVVVFAVNRWITGRAEKRLLEWGIPARAVIVSRTMATKDNPSRWTIEYSTPEGKLIRSQIMRGSLQQPGQEVLTVLYDRNLPHRFMIYPSKRFMIG
jgi:hypothetical protein